MFGLFFIDLLLSLLKFVKKTKPLSLKSFSNTILTELNPFLSDVPKATAFGSFGSDFFASSNHSLNKSKGLSFSLKQIFKPSEFFSFII